MLRFFVDIVVRVWYAAIQTVLNLVFASLCLLKAYLNLVPRGMEACLGAVSFFFAWILEFVLSLFNGLKRAVSLPVTMTCSFVRDVLRAVGGVKSTGVSLVRTCVSTPSKICERPLKVIFGFLQLLEGGTSILLRLSANVVADVLLGFKFLVNVAICMTNGVLSLVLFAFHLVFAAQGFLSSVVVRCGKVSRRVGVVCFRDLKTGKESEILRTSVTCYQVLKTGALAVVYALALCYHVVVTVICEAIRYSMACVISGAGSVHVVSTTACVMSDSDFCNHSHK